MNEKPSIAVLMTSFNRRAQTLECLRLLYAQTAMSHVSLHVILVDDASADGTTDAVQAAFPRVDVFAGTGKLYWNGGMRKAFAHALERGYDFYLWLNDDTQLFPEALATLLAAERQLALEGKTGILTGSTCDGISRAASYGGWRWKKSWKRELEPVVPDPGTLLRCDTMNGNCTLIPRRVAQVVGNLEAQFTHSFGDFDYGFRAARAGFGIYVVPGFVGSCSDNSRRGTWRDASVSLRQRWRHLNSVKGSPFHEWSLYCRRHLGALWPLYTASPYVKTVLSSFRRSSGASARG